MSCYFLIYILSVATSVCRLSAQPQISITTRVGSSALLPCDWRKVSTEQSSSQSLHVEWRTFTETVLERRGEQLYQSEEYEGRVDVPEDQLLKGNCSLVLKNVRAEDEGVYESYLVVKRRKRALQSKRVFLQSVELSIDEKPDMANKEKSDSISNSGVIHSLSYIIIFIGLGFIQSF